jgi:hypothetical protein
MDGRANNDSSSDGRAEHPITNGGPARSQGKKVLIVWGILILVSFGIWEILNLTR